MEFLVRAPRLRDEIALAAAIAAVASAGVLTLGTSQTITVGVAAVVLPALVLFVSPRLAFLAGIVSVICWVTIPAERPVMLPPTDFAIAALAIALLAGAYLRRSPVRWETTDILFVGFLVCAVLSMPVSQRLTSFAFAVKTEVVAYLSFRLTLALFANRRDLREALVAMLVIQIGLLTYFFVSYVNAYRVGGAMAVVFDRGVGGDTGGIGAPFVHANPFAALVALLLPPAAALMLMPGRRSIRIVAGAVALLSGASLLMSASRGATLAGLLGVVVIAWVNRRRPAAMLGAAGILALCVAALLILNPALRLTASRFATIGTDESSDARMAVWKAHADAILDRPLVGYGLDNVGLEYSTDSSRGRLDAHNFVLKTALQTGLIGLAFKLGIFGVFAASLWRLRHRRGTEPAYYGMFLAVFTIVITNSMVESALSGDRYLLLFMHMMGLMLVWQRMAPLDRAA
jgi:O-antigen ligase